VRRSAAELPRSRTTGRVPARIGFDTAIAGVRYQIGDVTFTRETFASHPDQAIVVHIAASKPGQVSFTARLSSEHTSAQTRLVGKDQLALAGHVEDGGMKFEARLRAVAEGGQLTVTDDRLSVSSADSATLVLMAATNFQGYRDLSADPPPACAQSMQIVAGRSFEALRQANVADHQRLFRRVSLDLRGKGDAPLCPAQGRAALPSRQTSGSRSLQPGHDPGLAALVFQYGRYLMIASSRPGGQPANLQGLWNDKLRPPWTASGRSTSTPR